MKKGRLGKSEQRLAVGPLLSLSMSLSSAMWNVGDVSFGRPSKEAVVFTIFSLFIFLMYPNVLSRGLKQATHR